jgi:outer membrane immunogenic protein
MKSGAVIRGVALAACVSLSGALSLPAEAADIAVNPRPAPAPVSPTYIPAAFFWTGYYLGITGGAAWGTTPFTDPFHSGATGTTGNSKGWTVGGVTGINYQIGWVVIGAEFDFTDAFIKSEILDSAHTNLQTDTMWTSTVTGRLGLAFDRVLVFGKGGGAFAYDRDTVAPSTGGAGTGSTTRTGWTVGGGVEYAITEHWIGRVEYDYLKFASKGLTFAGPSVNTIGAAVGLNINEVRGAISYKF